MDSQGNPLIKRIAKIVRKQLFKSSYSNGKLFERKLFKWTIVRSDNYSK